MLVRDWMTSHPLTVGPETSVRDALQLLRQHGFRRLPVLFEGELVGITTRKDLKDAAPSQATTLSVWEISELLGALTVGEMMARPVVTVYEDEDIDDAALRMQDHHLGGLPVLSRADELVGILTIGDVMRAFTEMMGLREGGQRLRVVLPDAPGELLRLAQVVQPSNLVSVVTMPAEEGEEGPARQVMLRISGEQASSAAQRLREAGFELR